MKTIAIALGLFTSTGSLPAQVPAQATNSGDLATTVGERGIDSLKYRGVEFSVAGDGPGYGAVELWGATFAKADGTQYAAAGGPTTVTRENNCIIQTFPWGSIAATYESNNSRLTLRVAVTNTSADELRTQLRIAALRFPEKPTGRFIDPGMWGNGGVMKLGEFPVSVGGESSPGVLGISSTAACLHVCLENPDAGESIGVPFPLNGQASDLRFPFVASLPALKAGQTHQLAVSFRFSPTPAAPEAFSFAPAGDVLRGFAQRHPGKMNWEDHRPIGIIMLASSGTEQPLNPRRWVVGNGTTETVDTTTPGGRRRFQALVMRWADSSIKVLRESNSQGMITWDIEGQEIPGATYYGKPHLVGKLAPEMEEPVELETTENGSVTKVKLPLIDAYFRKFRDAGLRVGVCLRPQTLVFDAKGIPSQQDADDQTAYGNLKQSLRYAKDRWGCTLYYVDSTCTASGAFSPWVFDRLHEDYPDVLMMPENQTLRNYAVTAPFDSYFHHGIARTSPAVREVWPKAFSCLMFGGEFAKRRAELVDGVRRGDILMFNAWYENQEMKDAMSIYQEAGVDMKTGKPPSLQPSANAVRPMPPAETALPVNPATTPAPIELAALLGQINDKAQKGPVDVVFVGDSITNLWDSNGKAAWEKLAAKYKLLNTGVPGIRTGNLLWQLQNSELKNLQPKAFVVMIGTNNLSANRSAEETVTGIEAVVRQLRRQAPDARIVLMGVLPRPQNEGLVPTPAVKAINQAIAGLADGRTIEYLDIGDKFLDAEGNVNLALLPDRLHPSAAGYEIWEAALRQPLAQLLPD